MSMSYPYYSFSSSPSLPGAWSSAWSLPQQYRQYETGQEIAEIKDISDDQESLRSSCNSALDLLKQLKDTVPPSNHTARSKADPPGALLASHHQESSDFQLLEPQYTSSQDDAISDYNTFPGENSSIYSCPSFCSSHKLSPLTFESNLSLETPSLHRASVSNPSMNSPHSTSSRRFSFSSESGDIDQETVHSCTSLRHPTEKARPSFDNYTLLGNLDTFLDKTNFLEHIPRNADTGRNYSSEFYPHPLLLSQPDGNNTWTLSLDPTISRPETILESSLELESLSLLSCASDHNDEAMVRIQGTLSPVYCTPGYDGSCLSLPPLQVGDPDIAEFSAASDVSVIVSSTSSVNRDGEGAEIFSTGNADLYFNGFSHDFPQSTVQDSSQDLQQDRSKKLVKKPKGILSRLKRLFTPKRTVTEAHATHPSKSVKAKDFSNPVDSNAQADTMPPASGPRSLHPRPSFQRYKLPKPTKSSTPSIAQSCSPENTSYSGSNIDEKYTYEYHARPKTLKEIKSQRRFSLPTVFIGSSSRTTSSTKRNITTSVPRSQSRPMSMYIS